MKQMLIMLLLGCSLSAVAGDPSWETDFDEAKRKAGDDKAILINFTGSDWCGWCKRLDREVFRKDAFIDFADQNLVLLKIDFPKFKDLPRDQVEKNYKLANQYKVAGYPTILLVDGDGKVKLKSGYRSGGAAQYVSHLKASL